MRVTMLVRCLAMMRGGGETRHLAWARELNALGVDVEIIAGRPLVLGSAKYPIDDVRASLIRSPYMRDLVYRVGRRRGFGRLMMMALHGDEEWFCRAAWSRIAAASSRPDIVHAHALHQAARLAREHIPVVINLPGPPHPRYTHDLGLADAIVADGWAAANLPAMLGRRVEAVPKGVDASRFRPDGDDKRRELGLAGKRVIVAVSRLVPIKNVRLLVDAMPAVLASRPDAHLLIVGEGPDRDSLGKRVHELQLARAVTFAGYVPQNDTPSYYRSADVFALSSEFDNSPNALLEAMACGLSVVSTDVGGVRGFVHAGRGSELVPAGDPDALAAALVRALTNIEASRRDGEHNRRFAVERYSWRASAQRLLEIYREVLARRVEPRSAVRATA